MPRLDPHLRERGVVDQSYFGEPAEHRVGGVGGHTLLRQHRSELGASAGCELELVQADLPGDRLRVGIRLGRAVVGWLAVPAAARSRTIERRPGGKRHYWSCAGTRSIGTGAVRSMSSASRTAP